MRPLRDPLGVRACGYARDEREPPRDGAQPRLDDELILVCALAAEERAARRAAARVVRVGLGAAAPLPDGRLVSFGLAGALGGDLEPGALVSVREVVDEGGTSLWAGKPLLLPGARTGVLCSAGRVVDDPGERAALAARTGADAVDMESGVLAMSGRLAGAVKAISDAPGRPLGRLAHAVTPAGEVNWPAVAAAFATQPRGSLRAVRGARRGLASLERAAAALAGG